MIHFSLKHKKLIAFGLAFAVFAFFVYESPQDNHFSDSVEGAIKKASIYSYYIRSGTKDLLRPSVSDAAKIRIESDPMSSMSDIAVWSELSEAGIKPPIHHHMWRPAVANFEKPENSVELMMLEKKDSFYVMTFAGRVEDGSNSFVFKGAEPMLISIGIRYYNGGDDNIFNRYARKVANLEWMPEFVKRKGEKGDWVVVDYGYSFTTRDYYNWVKANGTQLYQQAEFRKADLLKSVSSGAFWEKIQKNAGEGLVQGSEWSSGRVVAQGSLIRQQLSAAKD